MTKLFKKILSYLIITGNEELVVNAHMDSVAATFRDVIRQPGITF